MFSPCLLPLLDVPSSFALWPVLNPLAISRCTEGWESFFVFVFVFDLPNGRCARRGLRAAVGLATKEPKYNAVSWGMRRPSDSRLTPQYLLYLSLQEGGMWGSSLNPTFPLRPCGQLYVLSKIPYNCVQPPRTRDLYFSSPFGIIIPSCLLLCLPRGPGYHESDYHIHSWFLNIFSINISVHNNI